MRAWIVVESMFGNTREVADLIAESMSSHLSVDVFNVGYAPLALPADLDLLVVGGPTHAFGMSRASTRKDAVSRGSTAQPATGLREWLERVEGAGNGISATAFDTRVHAPVPGSAAKGASRRLQKLGFDVIVKPRSFYVDGVTGPLGPGERTNARVYGSAIALALEHARGDRRDEAHSLPFEGDAR